MNGYKLYYLKINLTLIQLSMITLLIEHFDLINTIIH